MKILWIQERLNASLNKRNEKENCIQGYVPAKFVMAVFFEESLCG